MEIRVVTHSGEDKIVEVAEYDPVEISQKINARDDLMIVIGDKVFSSIDVKLVEKTETENSSE